jgi:DNA polymerase-4
MVTEITFNPTSPSIMHIDLNSCFASVEQQANHLLRGKPVVVAAYTKSYGAILAPSVEAKLYGIKTGMPVRDALKLCPFLIVREADPPKYRQVHKQIGELLNDYSPHVISKSIDDFSRTLPAGPGPAGISIDIISHPIRDRGLSPCLDRCLD